MAIVRILSPLTVKGGVVRVIDSATGDVARTTTGYIEDIKYGWSTFVSVAGISAEFDSAVTRTGRLTAKFSTTDVNGQGSIRLIPSSGPSISQLSSRAVPVLPNTQYKISIFAKTNNVVTNSVYANVYLYDTAATLVQTVTTNKLSGTQDWLELTSTFTTAANATYAQIALQNIIAGNISDVWFDVNSMRFDTVTSITNSGSTPALFYPSLTAVSSTDNIDQSQVTAGNNLSLGHTAITYRAIKFTPTNKNFSGIIIQKSSAVNGTFTGDLSFSLQADSAGKPSGTNLNTPVVVSNATWNALSTSVDFSISMSYGLTPNTTYWVVLKSSTSDDTNYTHIISYSSGASNSQAYSANGSSWTLDGTKQFYFKTLYSKNTTNLTASTDTESISVTASTVDGWENGTVVDTFDLDEVTPLTLAPGANTIYVSCNGAYTADSKVDSSLQGIFGGEFSSANKFRTSVSSSVLKNKYRKWMN